MISSIGLIALFFTGTLGAPSQESECCQEKRVGDTFYTLLSDDSFSGGVPERCLNDCLYTAIGTSEPKFCFARGELPVECGGSGYGSGSGEGSGYGQSSVSISFIVRSATTNEDVSGAVVSFALGDIVLATTTDEFGLAIFTFSIDEIVVPEEGIAAIVEVSMENFVTYNYEKIIFAESMMEELLDWNVAIALSPDLADNEMRIVLSWETTQDLDIYALQMEKETGAIVCKTNWQNMAGCAGITLDVDSRHGENGSETITWNEGAADPFSYLIYVHDYGTDAPGFDASEARISFYGESVVKMEAEDGNNEDSYWMLGSFEPSGGISSFVEDGSFQTDNPDTSLTARNENPVKPSSF